MNSCMRILQESAPLDPSGVPDPGAEAVARRGISNMLRNCSNRPPRTAGPSSTDEGGRLPAALFPNDALLRSA